MIKKTILLAAILASTSCDDQEVEFRAAPETLYLVQTSPDSPDIDGFAKLVSACADAASPVTQPKVAVTWSAYEVGSGQPVVMGFSYSVALPPDQLDISDCYRKLMLSLGATGSP